MKRALSILLAVLMLASLCSFTAFADDDVVAEEVPSTGEFVEPEAQYVEAADAVEEFTGEGDFEAADYMSYVDFKTYIDSDPNLTIERQDPEKPKCGQTVKIWVNNAGVVSAEPTIVMYEHDWNAWETIESSSQDATCTEEGWLIQERTCKNKTCPVKKETRRVDLQRQGHVWGTDPWSANGYNYDPDKTWNMEGTINAVKVMPTTSKAGKGHEVCIYCGRENPLTDDYTIPKHDKTHINTDATYHLYPDWSTTVEATCLKEGWEERICCVPGCDASLNRAINPYHHVYADGTSMMEFDHIERVDCTHYVTVWVCSNPNCDTTVNAQGAQVEKKGAHYTEYRGLPDAQGEWPGGMNCWTLKPNSTEAANLFEYTDEDYPEYNTEFFEHHRYPDGEDTWKVLLQPRCGVEGLKVRVCTECYQEGQAYPIPMIEPEYGDEIYTGAMEDNVNGKTYYYHWKQCTRDECNGIFHLPLTPSFGKITTLVTDKKYFTQENNRNLQALVVDHSWSEWEVELKPTDSENGKGHWYRACTLKNCGARQDFYGTQAEFDEMSSHTHQWGEWVVIEERVGATVYQRTCKGCGKTETKVVPVVAPKNGLVWEIDEEGIAVCRYYKDNEFQKDFTGILDFDGGKFFVAKGVMCSNDSGLAEFGGVWYFLSNGQIQADYTGLALYDDEWFYLSNGVLDLKKNGLVDYDGSKFLLGAGRIQSEVNGLYLEDDVWYFIGGGQVATSYTGLVEYDGEWFYVEKGILVPFNGEVEYDGAMFNVVNGMVVD